MIQKLKNYLWHLPKAVVSSAWYRFPARKLTVIGVTGTKGKTTTAHMIYHLLNRIHKVRPWLRPRSDLFGKVGLISTIGAFFGDEEIDTGLHVTSPDARELQKLLRMAVDKGLTHMVLEVTSSGLDQFRVWGIKFKVAVITNIYPDHLDYHGTMEKYVSAKAKIIKQAETVLMPGSLTRKFANFANLAGTKLKIVDFKKDSPVTLMNKELVVAAVNALSIKETPWLTPRSLLFRHFPGVPGRMETVYDKKFKVVVDFAHTPESLAAALGELRKFVKKNGRLMAVFGCAGERDHGRRRMGEVAAKMADFFVITAEDPRSEKVEEISEEIAGYALAAGGREVSQTSRDMKFAKLRRGYFVRISDRQEAINWAIHLAKEGDVVGLFGKGHEKSMCYGKTELPWSEHEAVKKALRRGGNWRGGNYSLKNVAAVILAAGEGTRIKARRKNKVAYKLAGKPMIGYTVETLEKAGIEEIIVVVKFAEKSVRDALRGKKVIYAHQEDKKGTAPALESGLVAISPDVKQIVVMYGDDSAFYPVELFQFILTEHQKHESDVTLLSIKVDNPRGLGRILRNGGGEVLGIVEEKVATDEQKEIKEINTGCYCFRRDFIEKRIGEIEINPVSQEYYLTDIVEVALSHSDRVHVCLYPDNLIWHGINDRSQWAKAIRKKKYGEKAKKEQRD